MGFLIILGSLVGLFVWFAGAQQILIRTLAIEKWWGFPLYMTLVVGWVATPFLIAATLGGAFG